MKRLERNNESGATAIFVGLSMIVLIGFGAFVLDIGHFRLVRTQLHNASDAASLAASFELNGEDAGALAARQAAQDWAAKQKANGDYVDDVDTNADVQLGVWDFTDREFTELAPGEEAGANSVRVLTQRSEERGTAVQTWLARVLGINEASLNARSIAGFGGPACTSGFPIAIPECGLEDDNDLLRCGETLFQLTPSTVDNAGLTSLALTSANVPTFRDLIENYDPNAECNTRGGDQIRLQNGVPLNALRDELHAFFEDGPVDVFLPVIESPDNCDIQFNQLHTVVGYAQFTLVEVDPPPDQLIRGSLNCDVEHDGPSGTNTFGIEAKPVLVR